MSSVHQSLQDVVESLSSALVDAEKCDRGNKAARVRVRKAAQDGAMALKMLRKLVSELGKEEMPSV